MFSGIPTAFPSGQKEALKERLENQTLENLERENLTFLDEDQHPLELAGNFLKAESGVLLENGALGKGVCCTGSLAMLVLDGTLFQDLAQQCVPNIFFQRKLLKIFNLRTLNLLILFWKYQQGATLWT